jgi:hypothetical protein
MYLLFSGPGPPPHPPPLLLFPLTASRLFFRMLFRSLPVPVPLSFRGITPFIPAERTAERRSRRPVESDACICIPHCQDQKLKRLTRNHHPPNTSPAPCPLPAEQLTISPAEHPPEAAPRHKPTKSIQLLASPLLCSYTALDSSGFFRVVNLRIAAR